MPLHTLGRLNPADSLLIFTSFRVDRSLPKYAEQEASRKAEQGRNIHFGDSGDSFALMSMDSQVTMVTPPKSRLRRFWEGLWKSEPKTDDVQEVFTRIKASAEELTLWDERNEALTEMVKRARTAGQTELVGRLEAEEGVRKFENILYAKDRRKLISEKQLLTFTAKCEKGLCLDWVGDFVRPIPPEVVAEKAKCDADHLFDNYVVLHFDPKNRGTSPEAREKAKDPILFGVIKGSRSLYFVGDWVDELCDLTFQEIIRQLGSPLEMS